MNPLDLLDALAEFAARRRGRTRTRSPQASLWRALAGRGGTRRKKSSAASLFADARRRKSWWR